MDGLQRMKTKAEESRERMEEQRIMKETEAEMDRIKEMIEAHENRKT